MCGYSAHNGERIIYLKMIMMARCLVCMCDVCFFIRTHCLEWNTHQREPTSRKKTDRGRFVSVCVLCAVAYSFAVLSDALFNVIQLRSFITNGFYERITVRRNRTLLCMSYTNVQNLFVVSKEVRPVSLTRASIRIVLSALVTFVCIALGGRVQNASNIRSRRQRALIRKNAALRTHLHRMAIK